MALLRLEGFEGFGTTTGSGGAAAVKAGLQAKYTTSLVSGSGPRIWPGWGSGYCATFGPDTSADNNYILIPFGSSLSTVYCGFAFRPRKNIVNPAFLFGMWNSGSSVYHTICWLVDNSTLAVRLYDGSTQPISTATVAYNACRQGCWTYIEYKVVIHDTTGSVSIRINGIEIFNVGSLDTKYGNSTDASHLKLFGVNGDSDTQDGCNCFDDVYIDSSEFLGPIHIEQILPDGDTADEDWACSAGSDSFALINENPKDDDTTYISSATTTDKTLCDMGALAYLAANIKGLQVNVACKVDTGTVNLIPKIKSGASEGTGATRGVSSTSYITEAAVFETDPADGAWTPTTINTMLTGVEVG